MKEVRGFRWFMGRGLTYVSAAAVALFVVLLALVFMNASYATQIVAQLLDRFFARG